MRPIQSLGTYLRRAARVARPLADVAASALSVSEYHRGWDRHEPDAEGQAGSWGRSHGEAGYRDTDRRAGASHTTPWAAWEQMDGWGEGADFLAYGRELWTEQSFFHDADRGVLYAEAPWDARWRTEEWWR
jgi:hypothetical protein